MPEAGGTPDFAARAKNVRYRGVQAVAGGPDRCSLIRRALVRVAAMRAPRCGGSEEYTSTTRSLESSVVRRSTPRCGLRPVVRSAGRKAGGSFPQPFFDCA